jgi:hypothetical protein
MSFDKVAQSSYNGFTISNHRVSSQYPGTKRSSKANKVYGYSITHEPCTPKEALVGGTLPAFM